MWIVITLRVEESIKENTKTGSTTSEVTVVKVNETFINDNRRGRKKKFKKYAQVVITNDKGKTTHENVSCLKKDLQPRNVEKTSDLAKMKNILLQDEKPNSSRIQASPPVRVTNMSTSRNTSEISESMFNLNLLSSQDEDLENILEELQNKAEVLGDNITEFTTNNSLKGYFCSDTIFNLSHRVLSGV